MLAHAQTRHAVIPYVRYERYDTQQMLDAALPLAKAADLIVGVAAVADYKPERKPGKIRSGGESQIALKPNPDIIAELAKATKGKVLAFGLVTGKAVKGQIKRFDQYAVLVYDGARDILIYKHAIVGITEA